MVCRWWRLAAGGAVGVGGWDALVAVGGGGCAVRAAAHASYQHGLRVGLRALADVAQLVAVCALDWDVVCERRGVMGGDGGCMWCCGWRGMWLRRRCRSGCWGALAVGEEEAQLVGAAFWRGSRCGWGMCGGQVRGFDPWGAVAFVADEGGVGWVEAVAGDFPPRAVLMEMGRCRTVGQGIAISWLVVPLTLEVIVLFHQTHQTPVVP